MQALQNNREYKVVVNREQQYSIWPADRESPPGWRDVGFLGSRGACFAFIETVWIGARPLSLQKRMADASNRV